MAIGAVFGPFVGLGFRFTLTVIASAALVLEIDIVARHELVASNDFRKWTQRLHGAHQTKVMFCMLEIVLSQNAIAGGLSVTGQLLVFFVDPLGGASNLDPLGAVGIKRPIGIVLRLTPATATAATTAAAIAVAAALALHTLEISHAFDLLTALLGP